MEYKVKGKLGSGERFSRLKKHLESKPGIHDAGALAAYIGRKKLGGEKMSQLSQKGKNHGK